MRPEPNKFKIGDIFTFGDEPERYLVIKYRNFKTSVWRFDIGSILFEGDNDVNSFVFEQNMYWFDENSHSAESCTIVGHIETAAIIYG